MKSFKTLAVLLTISVFALVSSQAFTDDDVTGNKQNGPAFVDEDGDGVCDKVGNAHNRGRGKSRGTHGNFVDEDGDGICDNCGSNVTDSHRRNFVDADGDGVNDNFIDENGDGVCDNCLNRQNRGNSGANFVDEDGDGVCDNYTGQAKRSGKGKGNRRGR